MEVTVPKPSQRAAHMAADLHEIHRRLNRDLILGAEGPAASGAYVWDRQIPLFDNSPLYNR